MIPGAEQAVGDVQAPAIQAELDHLGASLKLHALHSGHLGLLGAVLRQPLNNLRSGGWTATSGSAPSSGLDCPWVMPVHLRCMQLCSCS